MRKSTSRPPWSRVVWIAFLIVPLFLGPAIALRLSLIPRTPPPDDIAWWVLCATPRGAESHYEAAYLIDWRPVLEGADTVVPFGTDTVLPVSQLEPIGDQDDQVRAQETLEQLEQALLDGAWARGPATVAFSTEGDRANVELFLDDYGTFRTVYRVSAEGSVSIIGATFSASAFGMNRDSPIVYGCWYGLLVGVALAVLWAVTVAIAARRRTPANNGADSL